VGTSAVNSMGGSSMLGGTGVDHGGAGPPLRPVGTEQTPVPVLPVDLSCPSTPRARCSHILQQGPLTSTSNARASSVGRQILRAMGRVSRPSTAVTMSRM
jgi:hypothetical protein